MALLLAALALLGCGVGDSHPSQVTDTRVIAAVVEPAQPQAGETVLLTVYVADPEERGVELLAWSCTPAGDLPCLELEGGVSAMVSVVDAPTDGTFLLARSVPDDVDALLAAAGEEVDPDELSAVVWLLACAPGTCEIIEEAREALAAPGDRDRAERLARDLADPTPWMRELPLSGVNLAARRVRLGRPGEERNENPVADPRFLTDEEREAGAFVVPVGDARSLRFAVFDANGTRADAYGYSSLGRFDAVAVREDRQDDSVVQWLLGPDRPDEGRVWVVFDDGDGGSDVFTMAVTAE